MQPNAMSMFSRNSPHNFKKQNTDATFTFKKQDSAMVEATKSRLVQLTIPTFNYGIVAVETCLEVKKPKTTEETLEKLFMW